MSRFVTLFCAVMAAVSGLFLYNKKQQTTALDHQIAQIVGQTERTRSQTAMLRAEWAMLNQPDRLANLASRYDRSLQTVAPGQFVQMSALSSHLPAVGSAPHHPAPAPRAVMVATLAADHGMTPAQADAPVTSSPRIVPAVSTAMAAHVDHAVATATPRHVETPHDTPVRAMAQNDVRTPPHVAAPEHVRAPERVAAVEPAPVASSVQHDTVVPATRMPAYRVRSQNIADVAWHPTAVAHMGSTSLGSPHVSALPPPVPVSN